MSAHKALKLWNTFLSVQAILHIFAFFLPDNFPHSKYRLTSYYKTDNRPCFMFYSPEHNPKILGI